MQSNDDFAIVVVAFNRLNSLQRLIRSLEKVNYNSEEISLIISIDYSGDESIVEYARDYEWKFGKKIVKAHEKRLGLKKHILSCGDYLKEFDAIAVLEDDIFVAPNFYNYMKQAVTFYKNDNRIAGISLYNHEWQIESDRPFIPEKNRFDNYFIQYAQSWGQIWMKNQWFDFIKWYGSNSGELSAKKNIPENLRKWPDSSWLKHHIDYCIQNDKYFVYPYDSLTTNFTDVGQHNKIKEPKYQVSMNYDSFMEYHFCDLSSNLAVIYDAFFERSSSAFQLKGIDSDDLIVNFYGTKEDIGNKKYELTLLEKNFNVVRTFGLELRPQELNVLNNIPGTEIKLYDLSIESENKSMDSEFNVWIYDNKMKDIQKMIEYTFKKFLYRVFK